MQASNEKANVQRPGIARNRLMLVPVMGAQAASLWFRQPAENCFDTDSIVDIAFAVCVAGKLPATALWQPAFPGRLSEALGSE
jgi:hypothetical protein